MDAVEAVREKLGLTETRLLDIVRDVRGAGDPPSVSVATAAELLGLFEWLREPTGELAGAAPAVVDWLRPNCDLSMVAAPFCLDPLAHAEPDRGYTVVNKTGTNARVRADVGFVTGPGGTATYAAIANWPDGADPRDEVMEKMRRLGESLRTAVS
jgi:beta-lactamase class A